MGSACFSEETAYRQAEDRVADSLMEFIRGKNERAQAIDENLIGHRYEWIRSVEELYDQVRGMLGESIGSEDVTARTYEVELFDDSLTPYTMHVLSLRIGGEVVEFLPKGMKVVGANGRVDIRGERAQVSLLREPDGRWRMVSQRIPRIVMEDFDREGLRAALERVMLP